MGIIIHQKNQEETTNSFPYQYFAGMGHHLGGFSHQPNPIVLNGQLQILYKIF